MSDSAEILPLIDRAVAAANAEQPPAEVWGWIGPAILEHIFSGRPLEECLKLRIGSGSRTVRTQYLLHLRNHHLRRALGEVWNSEMALAHAVGDFARTLWPTWQFYESPPESATSLQRYLFAAFACGVGVPKTESGLRKSLAELSKAAQFRGVPGSVNSRHGTDPESRLHPPPLPLSAALCRE